MLACHGNMSGTGRCVWTCWFAEGRRTASGRLGTELVVTAQHRATRNIPSGGNIISAQTKGDAKNGVGASRQTTRVLASSVLTAYAACRFSTPIYSTNISSPPPGRGAFASTDQKTPGGNAAAPRDHCTLALKPLLVVRAVGRQTICANYRRFGHAFASRTVDLALWRRYAGRGACDINTDGAGL